MHMCVMRGCMYVCNVCMYVMYVMNACVRACVFFSSYCQLRELLNWFRPTKMIAVARDYSFSVFSVKNN